MLNTSQLCIASYREVVRTYMVCINWAISTTESLEDIVFSLDVGLSGVISTYIISSAWEIEVRQWDGYTAKLCIVNNDWKLGRVRIHGVDIDLRWQREYWQRTRCAPNRISVVHRQCTTDISFRNRVCIEWTRSLMKALRDMAVSLACFWVGQAEHWKHMPFSIWTRDNIPIFSRDSE